MKRSAWLVLLCIALAMPVSASTFRAMSTREMLADSEAVVVGRVLTVNSFWSPSGRIILTEAVFQVEEVVVGEAPSVLVLRTAGGTVDGFTVEAHGFPEFGLNDRLLLFVSAEADGASKVVGYRQGQYRVVENSKGVAVAVPTLEADVALLGPHSREAARVRPIRLDVLQDLLRTEAARTVRHAH